jgi:hypothetical protein
MMQARVQQQQPGAADHALGELVGLASFNEEHEVADDSCTRAADYAQDDARLAEVAPRRLARHD